MEQSLYYSDERNIEILISLLKQNNIRKVVVSPGATNVSFVGSLQNDPFFEMYSCIDERSAAYMAVGLAAESGESVVISCTGATSSRNYMPALTEAYYRKLPILAVTSTQDARRIGHMVAQVTDRSVKPNDVVVHSEYVSTCTDSIAEWDALIRCNRAILALKHHGGGPVHINLATVYSRNFSVKKLPVARMIQRYTLSDELPKLPKGRIAIFIGSHLAWTESLTEAVDKFCSKYDAVAFCDHSSNYKGNFRVCNAIVGAQSNYISPIYHIDLLLHIGEISGDYASMSRISNAKHLWRINEDGELRDQFRKLTNVFEMRELDFFRYYADDVKKILHTNSYLEDCKAEYEKIQALLPELPFSNIWIAKHSASLLPENSVLHLGILNSLRSWNMFEISKSVTSYVNTGGFGIDGCLSTCLGGALAQPDKIHLLVIGDLAYFYDLNAMGNHHLSSNIRILLLNNGKGTEFRNYNHPATAFGDAADKFMAAGGHFGNKSSLLVKHFAEDLGFEYRSAFTKEEYLNGTDWFFSSTSENLVKQPYLFEVFTNSKDESDALYQINHLMKDNIYCAKKRVKKIIEDIFPEKVVDKIKSSLK